MITSLEMRILEQNSVAYGVSTRLLMENAGASIAKEIVNRVRPPAEVVVFAGKGGNAGDGFVAARHLVQYGFKVKVILLYDKLLIKNEDAKANLEILERMEKTVEMVKLSPNLLAPLRTDVIIDAVLGVGIKAPLREPVKSAIEVMNKSVGLKVAVDVPSGLNPDTGEIADNAVKADLTVTFHDIKPGLLKAKEYVGELVVAKIGIPPEASVFVGPGNVMFEVPRKPKDAHKGVGGKVAVIGGSETYTGAPAMAALAALRTGSDLAFVIAPEKTAYVISSYSPNIIAIKYEGKYLTTNVISKIVEFLRKVDAIIVGPGLGVQEETFEAIIELLRSIIELKKPVVVDADGLKALAKEHLTFHGRAVLTPHMAELARLSNTDVKYVRENRENICSLVSKKYEAVVLSKGPIDIVSDGEKLVYNKTGNPGMSVGGTGDTLTGIVGALLAKGVSPFKAAYLGAFINGLAGDLAHMVYGERILATDIIDRIPEVLEKPMESYVRVYG